MDNEKQPCDGKVPKPIGKIVYDELEASQWDIHPLGKYPDVWEQLGHGALVYAAPAVAAPVGAGYCATLTGKCQCEPGQQQGCISWRPRSTDIAKRAGSGETFQQRVQPWMMVCFGEMIAGDREERNHRFLEEALELVQACGCTQDEAHQLVDYVYGRPVGEPAQEVGGVMVTLAALCLANGLDMHANAETELTRIWTKVAQIRAKQAAKPQFSPLPEAPPPQPDSERDAPKPVAVWEVEPCDPRIFTTVPDWRLRWLDRQPQKETLLFAAPVEQPDSGRDAALNWEDAFEKHRLEQGKIAYQPGLSARPCFKAGWDAAMAAQQGAKGGDN